MEMKTLEGKDFFRIIFSFILFRGKMINILRFAISFLLVFLFSYAIAYSASSYYVDNSVGSSGNGSQGSPWKQFSNINWTTIGSASKPCTIYVSGGATSQTYTVAAEYMIAASGTGVDSEVIIKRPTSAEWSGHSGTVVISGGSGGRTFNITSHDYIIIDGLDFNPGNIWLGNCNYVIIRNCLIRNWTAVMGADGGITTLSSTGSPSRYVTIQNNQIGPPARDAQQDPIILGWNDHWIIEKNIFEYRYDMTSGSHADGIHMQDVATNLTIRYNWFRGGFLNAAIFVDAESGNNDTGPMNADIYGNIFENCTNPGSNGWQGILVYHDGKYPNHIINIYNNIFANLNSTDMSGFAIWFHSGGTSDTVKIENNIFYNAKLGVDSPQTTTGWTLNNNWYYNNDGYESGKIIEWKGSDYTSITTFNGATGFEATKHQSNPELTTLSHTFNYNHDFRPVAGSPVIDAGHAVGSPYDVGIATTTAMSGWPLSVTTVSSPQGSGWDIGAYEYIGGSPNPAPNPPLNLQ